MSMLSDVKNRFWKELANPISFDEFQINAQLLNNQFTVVNQPISDKIFDAIAVAFTDATTLLVPMAKSLSAQDNTIYEQLRERISVCGTSFHQNAAVGAIKTFQSTFQAIPVHSDPFAEVAPSHKPAPAPLPKNIIAPTEIIDGTAIYKNAPLEDAALYMQLNPGITKYRFEGCTYDPSRHPLQLDQQINWKNVTHLTFVNFKNRFFPLNSAINLQELTLEDNRFLETVMGPRIYGDQPLSKLERVVLKNNPLISAELLPLRPEVKIKIVNCSKVSDASVEYLVQRRVEVEEYSKPLPVPLKKTWNIRGWLKGIAGVFALGGIGLFLFNFLRRRSGTTAA